MGIEFLNIIYAVLKQLFTIVKPQEFYLLIGLHAIVALTLMRRKLKDPLEFVSFKDIRDLIKLFAFNTTLYVGASILHFVGGGNSIIEYFKYISHMFIFIFCLYNIYTNSIYASSSEGFKYFLVGMFKSIKSKDIEWVADWYTNSRQKNYLVKQNVLVMNGMGKVMRRACRYIDRAIREKHPSKQRADELKAICKDVDFIHQKIDLQMTKDLFESIIDSQFKKLEDNLDNEKEIEILIPSLQETKLKLFIVSYQQDVVKDFINTILSKWIEENVGKCKKKLNK